MLSICPSRYDVTGFFGITLATAFGISVSENPSFISTSVSVRSYDSLSSVMSKKLPGDTIETSIIAIVIEMVVVITKYPPIPSPSDLSLSFEPNDEIASTIEQKISGTMIM